MKRLYDFYVNGKHIETGFVKPNPIEAAKILAIPRYAHFKEKVSVPSKVIEKENTSKKRKR